MVLIVSSAAVSLAVATGTYFEVLVATARHQTAIQQGYQTALPMLCTMGYVALISVEKLFALLAIEKKIF